jgi:hypothetical protein
MSQFAGRSVANPILLPENPGAMFQDAVYQPELTPAIVLEFELPLVQTAHWSGVAFFLIMR